MAKKWLITKFDGTSHTLLGSTHGDLSEPEVLTILQRLACLDLSPSEIISASLRVSDETYVTLLERVGTGNPISVGENPHYTASRA